jgi:hypothetical protein
MVDEITLVGCHSTKLWPTKVQKPPLNNGAFKIQWIDSSDPARDIKEKVY